MKLGSFIQGRVSAYRDTPDLEGHRKRLREALGNTLSGPGHGEGGPKKILRSTP